MDRNLAQLEKLATIGQTASQIVHELNNPLTAIVAYSDYLTRRLKDHELPDSDIGRLMKITEAAMRIQRFCRELTDYSRPTHTLHAPIDIHDVIDRALSFCVHGLRSQDIAVERVYRDVPMVVGVDTALTQVFVNLITTHATRWRPAARSASAPSPERHNAPPTTRISATSPPPQRDRRGGR